MSLKPNHWRRTVPSHMKMSQQLQLMALFSHLILHFVVFELVAHHLDFQAEVQRRIA